MSVRTKISFWYEYFLPLLIHLKQIFIKKKKKIHQVKSKYFYTQTIQNFSLTDRQTDRLPFSVMTFRGYSFLSWREKKILKVEYR